MVDSEKKINDLLEMLLFNLKDLAKNGVSYLPKAEVEYFSSDNMAKNTDKKSQLLVLEKEKINDCKKCRLCEKRNNIVFGRGNADSHLVFVGEGPGEREDIEGLPFVGKAGQLLDKMVSAMGYERDEVYICNVVKCRPPENRDPLPDEIKACEPFLIEQLSIIKPKVIIGLGRYACQTLLKTEVTMGKMRGVWHEYEGIPFMPTFHPAYLLRNPPAKKEVWEDLQKVMERINN